MSEYLLIIPGALPTLNQYIAAERSNRYKAAKMKRGAEEQIVIAARQPMRGVHIDNPVEMSYLWVCKDKRTDRDNIAFAKKFVQDALVQCGVLKDDGWKYVVGFSDRFEVDLDDPRIEVLIKEVDP